MPSGTFPRRARLTGSPAFHRLLRAKQSARGERFIVQLAQNGGQDARLGIIVGKRIAPRAVDRNYLKRLIRESFRRQRTQLIGFDVLIRPSRFVAQSEAAVARKELQTLLASVLR